MRLLSTLALVFSAQAYACPQLEGTYVCKYQDGSSEETTITQSEKSGVTTYQYNASEVTADNVANAVPDDQSVKDATFRAWCDDDATLKAQLIGKYWNQGAYFGDLTLNMNFSKAGDDLKQTTDGEVKNSGGTYPIENDTTCTKK